MTRALREVFAEFTVVFDRNKNLEKGDRAVNNFKSRLGEAAKSIERRFEGIGSKIGMMNSRMRESGRVSNAVFDRSARSLQQLGTSSSSLQGIIGKLGGAFAALGITIGGAQMISAMQRFTAETVRIGDELDKTSRQLGITTHDLQSLRLAADLSGAGTERMNVALSQLSQKLFVANTRGGEMATLFRRIGIAYRDADGGTRQLQDVMSDLADVMQSTDNRTERVGIAMQLFGESGRYLLPMLEGGSEGLARMRSELDQLGGGMSELAVRNAADLNDSITRLKVSWQSFRSLLAERVLPALDWFVRKGVELGRWIDETITRSHILDIGWIGLKNSIKALGAVMAGVLVATIPLWAPLAVVVGTVVGAVAGLILLIDDLWVTLEGGESVTRDVIDSLFGIGATAHAVGFLKDTFLNLIAVIDQATGSVTSLWQSFDDGLRPISDAINSIIRSMNSLLSMLGISTRIPEAASDLASGAVGAIWRNTLGGISVRGAEIRERRARNLAIAEGKASDEFASLPMGTGARLMNSEALSSYRSERVAGRQGNVEQNIDNRSDISITVNEAQQGPDEFRRIVRDELSAQNRKLQAAYSRAQE